MPRLSLQWQANKRIPNSFDRQDIPSKQMSDILL